MDNINKYILKEELKKILKKPLKKKNSGKNAKYYILGKSPCSVDKNGISCKKVSYK